jgi:hypothetical protein
MTSLAVETTYNLQPEKRNWLLGPHGTEPGTTPTVTIDVSAFTAATHYPNGYIPSGTVVGTVTAGSTGGVPANTAIDVADAIVVHCFVDPNKLPFTTGAGALDAAARADLPMVHFAPVTP